MVKSIGEINEKEYTPRVTVGLLAYNEEKYLKKTIESILQQDYSDYEILIGDNASVDKTEAIIDKYSQIDSRIKHIRHPRNIGIVQNFNSLVHIARGGYFVLAGAHDLWSKNFLSGLAKALEDDPTAVIACPRTVWINEVNQPQCKSTGYIDTSGCDPVARFCLAMWSNKHPLYGLYRLEALRKTRLLLEIIGCDAVILGELALLGSFIVVPEAIWYRRIVRKEETREQQVQRYYRNLFSRPRRRILPHWRIPLAYIKSILRGRMGCGIRIALLLLSTTNSVIRYGSKMMWDVIMLLRPWKKR